MTPLPKYSQARGRESNVKAIFGGLTRASRSRASVGAKHLETWEARSIYLCIVFTAFHQRTQVLRLYSKPWQGARLNTTAMSGQERPSLRPGFWAFSSSSSASPKQKVSFWDQPNRSPHDDDTWGSKKKRKRLVWVIRHSSWFCLGSFPGSCLVPGEALGRHGAPTWLRGIGKQGPGELPQG